MHHRREGLRRLQAGAGRQHQRLPGAHAGTPPRVRVPAPVTSAKSSTRAGRRPKPSPPAPSRKSTKKMGPRVAFRAPAFSSQPDRRKMRGRTALAAICNHRPVSQPRCLLAERKPRTPTIPLAPQPLVVKQTQPQNSGGANAYQPAHCNHRANPSTSNSRARVNPGGRSNRGLLSVDPSQRLRRPASPCQRTPRRRNPHRPRLLPPRRHPGPIYTPAPPPGVAHASDRDVFSRPLQTPRTARTGRTIRTGSPTPLSSDGTE